MIYTLSPGQVNIAGMTFFEHARDAARHRQEASDIAHVTEDRDDERVRQVGGGLAGAYR